MFVIWRLNIGALRKAQNTLDSFTASGRALFYFFAVLAALSTVGLVYLLNASLLVAAPAPGGQLTEGLIGSPRFINPVLAISDADRDLTALAYSGLLHGSHSGEYVPDLAASYGVSEDGMTYTFVLRPEATFHDGTKVTAEDVVFTIAQIQDPALKSPMRASWDGVVVEAVDPTTVRFTLKAPYAPFIENLTLGILPKHLWGTVGSEEFPFSELNTEPIGSGPYRMGNIARSASGIPSSYQLIPFSGYALGAPYLSLTLRFYQSEEALVQALQGGEIDAASGLSPDNLAELNQLDITTSPLNRVFGVFFNQNQSEVLRDKDVRVALSMATDRQDLVQAVLGGYGTELEGPVPPSLLARGDIPLAASSTPQERIAEASRYLGARGWKPGANGALEKVSGSGKNEKTLLLSFSLSTGNVPELRAAAQYLKDAWGQLGAAVEIKIYEQGDLSQNVIRPRKYDALLFGEVIGRELDLYAFWHSSQRNDPGLNIALYANATADDVLEELRQTQDDAARTVLYDKFTAELARDIPALFLYAPAFVYSIPKDIQGVEIGLIEDPSDRFLSVAKWHKEVDHVWPFFAK